jgi:mono/diheme cytochrome c family protein
MRPTNPLSRPARSLILLLQMSTAIAASTQRTDAQNAGDASAGRELTKTWCDSCHMVDPAEQRGVSNGAPPFAAIAGLKSTTFMGLEVFLQTPHGRMPDLQLSRDQIDNVAAYILSLRK